MHTFRLHHDCKIHTARFEEGKRPSYRRMDEALARYANTASAAQALRAALTRQSFVQRNALKAVMTHNEAAQHFFDVANILEPGLDARRNVMCGRMRCNLAQALKFKSA